jgi:hypothetical protein
VENCTIYDLTTNGIDVSLGAGSTLSVHNTSFTNIGGTAVRQTSTAGTPTSLLTHVTMAAGGLGVDVLTGNLTISESAISAMAQEAVKVENSAKVNAMSCVMTNNNFGLNASSSGSTVNFANCDILNNSFGLNVVSGATGNRFGNSRIFSNGVDVQNAGTLNLQANQ